MNLECELKWQMKCKQIREIIATNVVNCLSKFCFLQNVRSLRSHLHKKLFWTFSDVDSLTFRFMMSSPRVYFKIMRLGFVQMLLQ